jgi:hypothetical protein
MYYGGFTYAETYMMPISYKRWFLERISKELKSGSESGENAPSRAAHADTAEMRAMQGRVRSQVPSRMRRFT